MTWIARLRDRVYADFLMPSRLDEYALLLEAGLAAGYEFLSLGSLWRESGQDSTGPRRPLFILRHDIDTDTQTARAMWELERQLGIRSSYFFRLSTFAPALMEEIAVTGGEVGYHYEEIATIAKRRHLRARADVLASLPEARCEFARNIAWLRRECGLPMTVAAAHGDFVNRRVGISNSLILADPGFRREVEVELEAYDESLLTLLGNRYTDVPYPIYWEPTDPRYSIHAGSPAVFVLVHPRHWRVHRTTNLRDDVWRVIEGLRYDLPLPRG